MRSVFCHTYLDLLKVITIDRHTGVGFILSETKSSAGESFVITWRLKNIGSCTWTTACAVVFVSGEQMGGPEDLNFTQNVTPGETVDGSINLTAPNATGDYCGN